MLEKYIIFLTFIPWIFMFIISIIKNLNNDNYLKFSFKYLRKNIFKIFRLDMFIFIFQILKWNLSINIFLWL